MFKRYIIDLDGCYLQIQQAVRHVPGVGLSVIPPQELARQALLIASGEQHRRELKTTDLFNTMIDLGVPTDYALKATDDIVLLLEDYLLKTIRLRLYHAEHDYLFKGDRVLEIYETPIPLRAMPVKDFWLDDIPDYYAGAAINESRNRYNRPD